MATPGRAAPSILSRLFDVAIYAALVLVLVGIAVILLLSILGGP